jgi:hypothetical protein
MAKCRTWNVQCLHSDSLPGCTHAFRMVAAPERRVCQGLTGTVQLCQHKSLALGELRDTLADPMSLMLQFGAGPLYPPLSCLDASHQADSRDVPSHVSVIRKRPYMTWSFWVLQEEWSERIPYTVRKCMKPLLESLVSSVHICRLRTFVGGTCLDPTNLVVEKRLAAVSVTA